MRILLAEDDTQLNKALTYQLESADFSVVNDNGTLKITDILYNLK